MSGGINKAVIRLLEKKRISAVGCLVNGEAWEDGLGFLKKFHDIDIGLHLSFRRLSFDKIAKLVCLRKINKDAILKEFNAQLECFCRSLGRFPDFIDSHQYIHQLPIFRPAFLELIGSLNMQRAYVRNTSMSLADIAGRRVSIFKNIFIAVPGIMFKKLLLERRFYTNNDFLGIYNFKGRDSFEKIFTAFVNTAKAPNSIFVVHPGYKVKPCDCGSRCFECRQEEEMGCLDSEFYENSLMRNNLYLSRFVY